MDITREVVYAFIDSQNLNLSVQNNVMNKSGRLIYEGWKLDYRKFLFHLRDRFKVKRAFLFIGRIDAYQGMYDALEGYGYQMIYRPTVIQNGRVKGNVDAELIMHTMIELPNYDKAIIVAGDGDYFSLIEFLLGQGKLGHILIPNRYSYSSLLRKYTPHMFYVSDFRSKMELKVGS